MLDFPGVRWVIQMDCPENATTYIHRVGRTARLDYKIGIVFIQDLAMPALFYNVK